MLLTHLASLCALVHEEDLISPAKLHWSDSLHWAKVNDTLIFSGSNSLRDWSHNLNLLPTKSPTGPGYVHSGFLNLARKTWPQLKETVLGGERIRYVTGYSLGAAVALLVAEKLTAVKVVTFACPAIGTRKWAERYPHNVTRCYVNIDLITTRILGREHVGTETFIQGGWNPITNHRYTLERVWD